MLCEIEHYELGFRTDIADIPDFMDLSIMKKLLLILFTGPLLLHAQIEFSQSWEEAVSDSRMTGKLVFFYAFAEWCEPCADMEEYTFTDLEVSNYFNSEFVNVQLNMDEYPGVELAERFSIAAFPSYVFINGNGQIVHRGCGAMDAAEFLYLGEEALSEDATLISYEKKYDQGERSTQFMMNYMELLEDACLNAEGYAASYLSQVALNELTMETPWEIFVGYQWDIFSREFQFLLQNKSRFEDSLGQKAVNAKLYDTYLAQYQEIFEAEELHDFGMRALLHAIKDVTFSGSDTLKLMMELHYAEFAENWVQYADYAVQLVGMTGLQDPEQLNELAWKFYLFVDDKSQLEIASSWAQQAIETQVDPSFIDTYASLQYKLGKRKKAVELEKRALELARELYEDITHFEHQLRKFEAK